jgi:hypothetical protein
MYKERDGILSRTITGIILVAGMWFLFWLLLHVWKIPTY